MRTKAILLKILMLAVLIPTATFAQAQAPTRAELYEACMAEESWLDVPRLAEDHNKYLARMEAGKERGGKICACEAAVEMRSMDDARALGYDGSEAASERLDHDPALRKKLMGIVSKMTEEKIACSFNEVTKTKKQK